MYRAPQGHKRARIQGCRKKAIPPSAWEDIRPDRQCYLAQNLVETMFNNGLEVEEIGNKIKKKFRMEHWQWEEILFSHFGTDLELNFCEGLVAADERAGCLIPLSTPDADPCFLIHVKGCPASYVVALPDKIMRYVHIRFYGTWGEYSETVNELYPLPQESLTAIILSARDDYVESGMQYSPYIVRKWMMGFDKCEIYHY